MTDKFTLEEIEAAVKSLPVGCFTDDDYWREVKKRLTRPKHKFRNGEVVYDARYDHYIVLGIPDFHCRPLRLSEMPQAVEDFRNAVAKIPSAMGDAALAKFDAEVEK